MKNINYYEEVGVDYENSGAMFLVDIIDTIEKFVKGMVSKLK